MSKATETSHREHWLACARRVSRTVNLGWWLEMLAAPLLVAALIGAAALLVVRREQPALEPWILPAAIGGVVVLTGLACWWLAARKFEQPDDSLVRIEASMRLRNALSAAKAGVAPWPAPVENIDAGISWQWPRLIVPPLGALVLLAAGWFIPVSAKGTGANGPPEQPQAWRQLDSELAHLTQEQVVDEKYLEDTRKRLEELKSQEEEQWFSHSSLEATDSLKKSHRAETERIERELGKANKALENLEKNAGATQAEKNRMMEDFDQALQGLQNGAMKPNPKLLEQMKGLDMKDMANLTPEQLQQLRENMKKNADAMKKAKGEGQGEGSDWSDELLAGDGEGEGNGEGEGQGNGEKDGEGPGSGGINRGPGHDPNVLGKEKEGVDIGSLTGLEAKDLSNSTPGDLLELQDGEHDVDKSASGITQGGNTDATGRGGDRVWKDSLDPAEQRALKKFFE